MQGAGIAHPIILLQTVRSRAALNALLCEAWAEKERLLLTGQPVRLTMSTEKLVQCDSDCVCGGLP